MKEAAAGDKMEVVKNRDRFARLIQSPMAI
jgi:hypothetical protein